MGSRKLHKKRKRMGTTMHYEIRETMAKLLPLSESPSRVLAEVQVDFRGMRPLYPSQTPAKIKATMLGLKCVYLFSNSL